MSRFVFSICGLMLYIPNRIHQGHHELFTDLCLHQQLRSYFLINNPNCFISMRPSLHTTTFHQHLVHICIISNGLALSSRMSSSLFITLPPQHNFLIILSSIASLRTHHIHHQHLFNGITSSKTLLPQLFLQLKTLRQHRYGAENRILKEVILLISLFPNLYPNLLLLLVVDYVCHDNLSRQ